MGFYYKIHPKLEDTVILTIPSPYIIEEYAKTFMQEYIRRHNCIMALPDGIYNVSLHGDVGTEPQKRGMVPYTSRFVKHAYEITFIE